MLLAISSELEFYKIVWSFMEIDNFFFNLASLRFRTFTGKICGEFEIFVKFK